MNLARSSLKIFAANIVSAGLGFLGITYFAREVGAATIGAFFLFQALLGILTIPADFGLRGAVEKRISEGDSQSQLLSSAIALKTVPLIIIVIGILLLRPLINNYLGARLAILLAAAIVLQETAQLAIFVLKGELRVGETAILRIARQTTWVGVGAFFVTHGYGSVGLVYGLLAGFGVMLVGGWYKISVTPDRPSIPDARSLFDYGKYNLISSIGGKLYSWTDVAVIGFFLTQTQVGAYEIAWRVTAISLLFSKAIAGTIFPQVSEWKSKDLDERIGGIITQSITPTLFFVIPAFLGTAVFSEEILTIVFGEEYAIAAVVLVLLMCDKVFQSVQLLIGRSLQAIDKPNLAAQAAIISLVVNILLNIVFVIEFGILGAALATVISSLLNDLLHFIYLRRFISFRFPRREILECLSASGMMAIILYGISVTYAIQSIGKLISSIVFGIVVYIIAVFLMPNLRDRLFDTLRRVGVGV